MMKKYTYLFTALALLLLAAGGYYLYPDSSAGQENTLTFNDMRGMTPEERSKAIEATGATEAAYLEYIKTFDPATGEVPTAKGLEAFKAARKQARNLRAIPGVEWFERGPNNVAGRIRAIMFDPNDLSKKKVWGGAEHGGLWYNNDVTDPASSWYNVNDFWANLSIGSIAYDPTNTQVFYVGTGVPYGGKQPRGAGIWKTTNGGGSWTQLSSTANNANFYHVSKIVVTSSGTVLANTNAGIFRSTDAGNSWNNVLAGKYASDMEIAANGTIYSGVGPDYNSYGYSEIFRSTNDGQSWTELTMPTGLLHGHRIEIATGGSGTVYAVSSDYLFNSVQWLIKSTDGGNSWTELAIPKYEQACGFPADADFTRGEQANHDLTIEVHPTNANLVILGGIDNHRSTDGGATFEQISYWTGLASCASNVHADQLSLVFRPGYPNEVVFGNDGGVYYSPHVGNASVARGSLNIQSRNKNLNITEFYAVDQLNSSSSNYMLAGSQDNGTQQFKKPGISSTSEARGGDGGFTHIDQNNSDVQLLSYIRSSYSLSTNGGKWFSIFYNDNKVGRFINPTDYDDNTNIFYAAGNTGDYLYSTDLENSSTKTMYTVNAGLTHQISAVKVSPYTANRIFVITSNEYGGQPHIYRIDNANSSTPTVTDISGSQPFANNAYGTCIQVGASDNQLLATFSNYGIVSVYESRDGGATWVNREGNLPDMPIRWGLYNPNNYNEVMLATQVGVWSTDNINTSSPDWGVTNANLANVRCDMLQYRQSDGYVAIATYGRGVYTTNVWSTTSVSDIAGHWAENEITYMLKHNFLAGYSDGTFRPDNELTRAEFATMIANIINPDISSDPAIAGRTFTDITGHWAEQNILQAARSGYLAGYGDGTFRPNDKITKLQITISIANGLPVSGGSTYLLSDFLDQTSIPSWAAQSVSNAYVNKLIANYPNRSYFTPNVNATRAMAVVTLYQALANLGRISFDNNFYIVVPAGYRLAKDEAASESEIALYPNPASDYVQIELASRLTESATYQVYDLRGQRIKEGTWSEGKRLDISSLAQGQYLIHISTPDNTFTKKFIKE
ncbi:S-layer homology domain-containing protein [Roseivirga sp. BDSF3-8]|uniref:S-layer homology domain-containing protein n=1 Tax=Roseivirga sp. BDSF3-8 TaxID=3241598 RepID=UPI0035317F17